MVLSKVKSWGVAKYFTPERCTGYLIISYLAYFSLFTITRHKAFLTQSFDLSVYVQMLWNSLHGDFFRVTIQPGRLNYLQHHFAPSMALFIPLYWIWQDPQWLLILQTAILASGAWPIFLITSRICSDKRMGVTFALTYLLYPALQAANLYDFHEITIAAPILAWAWYFAQERRWMLFGVACALALGFREEVVILTTGFGIYLLRDPLTRREGKFLILSSIIWLGFLLSVSFYQQAYAMNAALYFRERFEMGSNPLEGLKSLLFNPSRLALRIFTPQKLAYLIQLFAPIGFLLFFSWEWILLVLPLVGLYLLGSYALLFNAAQAQYNVIVVPFIVIASAFGVTHLQKLLSKRTKYPLPFWQSIISIFLILLAIGNHLRLAYLPLSPYFQWPVILERHRIAEHIAREIPVDASLSVQDNLAPHASHRKELYIFPQIQGAKYVFLDLVVIQDLKKYGVMDLTGEVRSLMNGENYQVIIDEAGFLLLKRID